MHRISSISKSRRCFGVLPPRVKWTMIEGRVALEDLQQMPLTRYPHAVFLPRIWDLGRNDSAYDAAYLALAEALGAPLVTRDARLGSTPDLEAVVEVL